MTRDLLPETRDFIEGSDPQLVMDLAADDCVGSSELVENVTRDLLLDARDFIKGSDLQLAMD